MNFRFLATDKTSPLNARVPNLENMYYINQVSRLEWDLTNLLLKSLVYRMYLDSQNLNYLPNSEHRISVLQKLILRVVFSFR